MASTMLEAALAYARQGLHVLPLKSGTGDHKEDKKPLPGTSGATGATTNEDQIRKWWTDNPDANIGINWGMSKMMLADFDLYKPEGKNAIEDLEKLMGEELAETWELTTPQGGVQMVYRLKADETCPPSAGKITGGLDIRSEGSYSLVPPSRTAKGAYTWVSAEHPLSSERAARPSLRADILLHLAGTNRNKDDRASEWIIEPDLPENVDLAVKWLEGAKLKEAHFQPRRLAVQGEGGDHTTYATAGMMRSFGISQEKAFELMLAFWNDDCEPPWDPDDLLPVVEHAYTYATSMPGNVTQAHRKARVREDMRLGERRQDKRVEEGGAIVNERTVTVGRFTGMNRAALQRVPPMTWLVRGWLPAEAYAMIYAPPDSYKSFAALDLCLSIASEARHETWGDDIEVCGDTLYLAGEGRGGIKQRVMAWETQHNEGQRVEGFYAIDGIPAVASEEEQLQTVELAKELNDGQPYELIVIDTVGRSMQGVNENAQEHASSFTRLVETVIRELSGTVLAVHHTGHDKSRARGSSVFAADADTIIRAEASGRDLTLSVEKQKDGSPAKPKHFRLKTVDVDRTEMSDIFRQRRSGGTGASEPETDATSDQREGTSLAVVKSDAPSPKTDKPNKRDKDGLTIEQMQKLDTVAYDYMHRHRDKYFSQNRLTELMHNHRGIDAGEKAVRKAIKEMAADPDTWAIGRCFDVERDVKSGQFGYEARTARERGNE